MVLKKIEVKIKKLSSEAKIPVIKTDHSAGFDLFSVEDCEILPGETRAISTGISIELPQGVCVQIWDRSGLGFKGIHRFAGLIDSDYRGEYKIVLHNNAKDSFKIEKGDRIAQGLILNYFTPEFKIVEDLSETSRGEGRFGSTGMK